MTRTHAWLIAPAASLALLAGLGAAPATPTYHAVLASIQRTEAYLQGLTPEQNPHAAEWNRYFDGLRADLGAYSSSPSAGERVAALQRLYRASEALASVPWASAAELREELRSWLRPRTALAWAEYRVLQAVEALPEDSAATRDGWAAFIRNRLRAAQHDLEAADTVANRLLAQDRMHEAFQALRQSNQAASWSRTVALESAVADLYNMPDFEAAVDRTAVVNAVMKTGLVQQGWIYFKGQWSYVNPGPLTGVGFVPTADGIMLSISQAVHSTTPVQGFQEQVAQDPKGQRAAKLYQFDATTRNDAVLTTTILFRLATGVQIAPGYQHGISASIGSLPQQGKGLGRFVASLVGYGQNRITNEVYEGAIDKIRQQVVESAGELAGIQSSQKADQINAQLRPYVLDAQTVALRDFGVTDLRMQTFPEYALIRGSIYSQSSSGPRGTIFPQPSTFQTLQQGVTVDVNLASAGNSLSRGYFEGAMARDVENVMIVTTTRLDNPEQPPDPNVPAGPANPKKPGVEFQQNVPWETYLARVQQARAQKDVEAQAIRLYKPKEAPKVAPDANGHLVVYLPEMTLEVPAPPQAVRGSPLTGPPAQVYRIQFRQAEFLLDLKLQPYTYPEPAHVVGQVVQFDPGGNVQVWAINEDPDQPVALNALTARIVGSTVASRLKAMPFDVPIEALRGGKVQLIDASAMDPTGWMRLVVIPL
jgi:hypothetical protein